MAFRRGDIHTRIDEPFDTGRCDVCSRTYRRLQSVGLWKPETFAPMCRMCRMRELTLDLTASTTDRRLYTCRLHPRQKWAHDAGDDQWTEYSPR